MENRYDWSMRHFVDDVVAAFRKSGDRVNAAMHMFERGVPLHVAMRVLS